MKPNQTHRYLPKGEDVSVTETKGLFRQFDNNDLAMEELTTTIRTCAELAVKRPITTDVDGYLPVALEASQVPLYRQDIWWYLRRNPLSDINNRVLLSVITDYLVDQLPQSLSVFVVRTSKANLTTIHAI